MKITKHGFERSRERAGLKPASVERLLPKVLAEGIRHSDTTGRLHKYMSWLFFEKKTSNNNRIYGYQVYILRNETLITVIPLPPQYKDAVDKLRKKIKRVLPENEEQHGLVEN